MTITILLDHDLEGFDDLFIAGLRETGWDQALIVEFKRLRDFGLPDNQPDQEIWRFVQEQRIWLVTNNRNNENETSLQATIEREGTPDSLPVITVSDKNKLYFAEYRQQVATSLVEIVIYPEKHLGTGRLYVP
jgi:hypothetical protein